MKNKCYPRGCDHLTLKLQKKIKVESLNDALKIKNKYSNVIIVMDNGDFYVECK
ncbi:MAG: hypothetical protein ACTSPY_04110 [Candidatus Helarchaeota archaeon]